MVKLNWPPPLMASMLAKLSSQANDVAAAYRTRAEVPRRGSRLPRIPVAAGALGRYIRCGYGTSAKPVKERREILVVLSGIDVEHGRQDVAILGRPSQQRGRGRAFDDYVS